MSELRTRERIVKEEQQLVVLQMADEEYGINILQVQEIIPAAEITRIPGMPDFIEGVINLRGRIIPVIDLRKRFGLQVKERDDKTRIVITEVTEQGPAAEEQSIGFMIDSISEVIRVSKEQIDPLPPAISKIKSEYLSGIAKYGKRIVILLEIKKVLSDIERVTLEKIQKEA